MRERRLAIERKLEVAVERQVAFYDLHDFAVPNDDGRLLAGLEALGDIHAVWDGEGLFALVTAEVQGDLVGVHAGHRARNDFDRDGVAVAAKRQLEAAVGPGKDI